MFDDIYSIDELDQLISSKQKTIEDYNKILASTDSIKDESIKKSQIAIIQSSIDKVNEELNGLYGRRKTLGQEIKLKDLLKEKINNQKERQELLSTKDKQIEEINELSKGKAFNEDYNDDEFDKLSKLDNSTREIDKKIKELDYRIAKINSILDYFSENEIKSTYEQINRENTSLIEENNKENITKEEKDEEVTPAMQEIINMVVDYFRYNEKEEELVSESNSLKDDIDKLNKEKKASPEKASIIDTRISMINGIISSNDIYIKKLEDWKQDIDIAMMRYPEEENAKAFKYVQDNKTAIFNKTKSEVGAEIFIDIDKLEHKWDEIKNNKDATNEEIYKYSSELASAYQKQINRYDTLLEKYTSAPLEYKEVVRNEKRKCELSLSYYQQISNEHKLEEPTTFVDYTVEQLQEEILTAQEKINETENKLDEAAKNKEFFTSEALRLSKELRDKNEELINIINEYQGTDAKELKELEIEQAKRRLELASENKLKYENITKELGEELSQTKALITRNQELINDRIVSTKDLAELTPAKSEEPAAPESIVYTQVLDPFFEPSREPVQHITLEPAQPADPEPAQPVTPESAQPANPEPAQSVTPEPAQPANPEPAQPVTPEPAQPADPEPTPTVSSEPVQREGRVLEQILVDIYTDKDTGDPINVTHIQRKRLERSNISVTRNFVNDVKNGNTLYNVMAFIPALIIHAPMSLFQKISGIVLTTQRTKDKVAKIRKNIQDLPDEDKKVLFKKYKNAKAFEDRAKGADGIIREEAMEYLRTKEIAPRVKQAGNIFTEAFESYKLYKKYTNIIDQLENGLSIEAVKAIPGKKVNIKDVTKEDLIKTLKEVREKIVIGQAAKIKKFQQLNDELSDLYSGSGLHAIEEEERAKSSKMNERGKRFATDVGTADGWEERKERANVQAALREALTENKDLESLLLFVKSEQKKFNASKQGKVYVRILKDNPLIPEGIPIFPAGIGEIGTINYIPYSKEMDYRPDPFIRNMISTLAITATLANSISQIHQNIQADKINADNTKIEADIHAKGKELESHQDALNDGMADQRELAFTAERNHTELHDHYWDPNAHYSIDDSAHHLELRDAYDLVNNNIKKINEQVESGEITSLEGLNQIKELNSQVHSQYVDVLKQSLPNIETYVKNHNYDYNVLVPAIKKMIDNPHGLDAENQALFDSIQTGSSLQAIAITELPTNLALPIIGLGGAALITGYAASLAQKGYKKPEDNLTEYVEDSIELDKELSGQQEIDKDHTIVTPAASREPIPVAAEPIGVSNDLFEQMMRESLGEGSEPQPEPVRSRVHK